MKTTPLSIRLDQDLHALLSEGAKRTRFNKRELLRRTLRLHLRDVIERKAIGSQSRITNIEPWAKDTLTRAYRRIEKDWERVEAAATAAQGPADWND